MGLPDPRAGPGSGDGATLCPVEGRSDDRTLDPGRRERQGLLVRTGIPSRMQVSDARRTFVAIGARDARRCGSRPGLRCDMRAN